MIQAHANLDQRLRLPNGNPIRLNPTAAQKQVLVAFMKTLTDNGFLPDPRYSDPFPAPGCPDGLDCIYTDRFE